MEELIRTCSSSNSEEFSKIVKDFYNIQNGKCPFEYCIQNNIICLLDIMMNISDVSENVKLEFLKKEIDRINKKFNYVNYLDKYVNMIKGKKKNKIFRILFSYSLSIEKSGYDISSYIWSILKNTKSEKNIKLLKNLLTLSLDNSAKEGNFNSLKFLLNIGAESDAALYYTVRHNNVKEFNYLFPFGGMNKFSYDLYHAKFTPIFEAVHRNYNYFINKLLDYSDLNHIDKYGNSLLYYSMRFNDKKVVKLLISNGAKLKVGTSLDAKEIFLNYAAQVRVCSLISNEKFLKRVSELVSVIDPLDLPLFNPLGSMIKYDIDYIQTILSFFDVNQKIDGRSILCIYCDCYILKKL